MTAARVSFLLFTYNHEAFVEEALRSALDQDFEGLEVIVTDDASTDGTAAVVERVIAAYRGPKPVRFRRHAENQGICAAINGAVSEASGDIMILAGGDDVAYAHRTARLVEAFDDPKVMLAWSNADVINETGAFERLHYSAPPHRKTLRRFANPEQAALGAANACRRDVFTRLGPLDPRAKVEDRTILMRATILGEVAYIDEPLLGYRRHGGNLWLGRAQEAGQAFESWRAYQARHTSIRISVYEAQLVDLERALDLPGVDQAEVRWAIATTREHLRQARQSLVMHTAANPVRKLLATASIALSGSPRATWRWLKANVPQRAHFRRQQLVAS